MDKTKHIPNTDKQNQLKYFLYFLLFVIKEHNDANETTGKPTIHFDIQQKSDI